MASFVNVADVLTAAVEIERRGRNFYESEAGKAGSGELKDFFTFLANEEVKHGKLFEEMLKRVGGLALPVNSSTPEYMAYVSAALDSHLLFVRENPGGGADSVGADPYLSALRMEKDTIVYFLAMSGLVPEVERKHIDACVEEEKRHMALIQEKRRAAAAPKE
ncbi:MAG: ferritin family protein [Deltaproteobacteria bacterium]|jgi:rubrerythrin|nr:ferritin family protein [Deltaproteobacteria bacterium]